MSDYRSSGIRPNVFICRFIACVNDQTNAEIS